MFSEQKMTAERGCKKKWGGRATFFKGKLTSTATLSTSAGTDDTNPASDNTADISENITKQRDNEAHRGEMTLQTNKNISGHDIHHLQGGVKIAVTHTNTTAETSTETTTVPLSQKKRHFVKALLRRKVKEAPKKDVPWELKMNLPKERARVEAAFYALEARKLLDSILPDDKDAIDQDSLLGGPREMEGVVRKAFGLAAHSQKLYIYATASSHDMSSLGGGETKMHLEKINRYSSLAKSLSSADRSAVRKTNKITLASNEPGNQTPVSNRGKNNFTTVYTSDEESFDELDEIIRNTMHNAKAYLKVIVRDFDVIDWDTFELETESTIECKLDDPIESFELTAMEYYGDEQSQNTIEKTLSGLVDTVDDTTATTTRRSRYYEDKETERTIRTNESDTMVKSKFDSSPDPFNEIVNRNAHYSGDKEGDSVFRWSVGDPFGTLENAFTLETFEANEGNMIFGRSDGNVNENPNGCLKELDNRGEILLGNTMIHVFDRTFRENLQEHEEEVKRLHSLEGRIDAICGAAIQETELIHTGKENISLINLGGLHCMSRLYDTIQEELMVHDIGYSMNSDNTENDSLPQTSSPVSEDSGLGSECGQEVEIFYEEYHIPERTLPKTVDAQFKTSGLKKGKHILTMRNFIRQNKQLAGIHNRPRGSLKMTRLKNIRGGFFRGKTLSNRMIKSSKSKKHQGNREMTIITKFSDMNDPDLPEAERIIEHEQVIITDASEVGESPTHDLPRVSRLLQRTELSAELTKGSTLGPTNSLVVEAKNKRSHDIEKCISARNKMPDKTESLFDRILLQCGAPCQVLDTTTKLPLM